MDLMVVLYHVGWVEAKAETQLSIRNAGLRETQPNLRFKHRDTAIKTLIAIIILLILHLQYRLWLGDASVSQISEYHERLDELNKDIQEKKERNDALYAEVLDLRRGLETIEERARYELGMIKENETFFQVLE